MTTSLRSDLIADLSSKRDERIRTAITKHIGRRPCDAEIWERARYYLAINEAMGTTGEKLTWDGKEIPL